MVSPTDILANTGASVVGRTNPFDLKVIRCPEGKDRENLDGKGDQDKHHSPSSAANLALGKGVVRTGLGVGGSCDSPDASRLESSLKFRGREGFFCCGWR